MNVSGPDVFDYFWSENLTTYPGKRASWSDTIYTLWKNGKWEIPLYSTIFLLAVVGNILVILTLVKNIRMRTNTNVFLLNLALSDLILAVLCMPFTLIGTLLRDFVFGEWMCKLVPFLQATSVTASVWTLVALSIERYCAICHPLRSRRWQTLSHAYHLIGYIWMGGAAAMLPVCILSELKPTNRGRYKCRESWPGSDYEKGYNLFLDFLLLVIPLAVLGVTYYLIANTLWRDLAKYPQTGSEKIAYESSVSECYHGRARASDHGEIVFLSENLDENSTMQDLSLFRNSFKYSHKNKGKAVFEDMKLSSIRKQQPGEEMIGIEPESPQNVENSSNGVEASPSGVRSYKSTTRIGLRHTNYERNLRKKQRVIKMLFVVVLEFFVCWTPLYVINTLALFWPHLVYEGMGYKTISFCQLLAYTSGCCNPITYCFMNRGFRNSFISLFSCCRKK